MLKHVQVSPQRSRADSVSLSSTASLCSLAEPLTGHSRAPSYTSLSDTSAQTTIKVYAKCLRPDIEYKTLSVTFQSTSREVVAQLLGKYRMKHRDPRLFYLTMEVAVRRAGVRTLLVLGEEARPAALQACHPKGYSKFSLQTRRGGLVRIYDSALMSNSQYKSLLISDRTTADELLALLLSCYNSSEKVEQFSLYEVCESQEYQRKLHPDDLPLLVQQAWQAGTAVQRCHFLVRRNPDYRPLQRRKQMLWSHEFQPSTKQLPFFSTMQQTLQSFSSLSLSSPLTDKKSHSDDVLNNTDTKIYQPRNKSIDSILEENGEKWGNYVNFKCESLKPMVTEKSHSCDSEKNAFCTCKTCENSNAKSYGNSSMVSSKSCHQIGCYSPVYKYPSIGSYCAANRFSNKSFDTTSLSSIESDDLVTSTPNQSPIATTFGAASLDAAESRRSLPPPLPATSKLPPLAAPRKKISHSHADYENYFYI